MNKAILVIDMPECCKNCMCYVLGAKANFCEITRFAIFDNTTKPSHCPLKPVPAKKEIPAFDHSIKAESDNAFDVGAYMYSRGELHGWNYCIEDLIGK